LVLSLFPGIGLLDRAFEEAGFCVVRGRRYPLAEACRLQGLPEDFLSNSPFRADAKLRMVANGVPLPMGRALANTIRRRFPVFWL
jgi:site-specific DNA-cytosine methylase